MTRILNRRRRQMNGASANRDSANQEGGVTIVLIGLLAIVLFSVVGLAVDVGRMFITKAQLSRAVDAAALSGVLEFNGTTAGLTAAENKAVAYFDANEPGPGTARSATANGAANEMTMTGNKTVSMLFAKFLGVNSVTVTASATAGFGNQILDTALVLDATGSMAGTPIAEAKNAAKAFKNTLLGTNPTGNVVVGVTPFRGCFRVGSSETPAVNKPMPNSKSVCAMEALTSSTQVTYLMSNSATLDSRINNIDSVGGSGTNICGGLAKGWEILEGPGNHVGQQNARRFLILLSDGDSTYNGSYSYQATPLVSPHTYQTMPCVPPNNNCADVGGSSGCTALNQSDGSGDCTSPVKRERQSDMQSWAMAKAIKADGVEIFTVAFGVCSSDTTTYTTAQCDSQIGNTSSDSTADQRLMKCIASSAAASNDHYYYATSASQLSAIFTSIANQVGHRLID